MSETPIELPELIDGIATTRAIRRFRRDPIPDEDLSAMLFAATRAPSGSNRQLFRFIVLRDGPVAAEAKALLGQAFRDGWNHKRGTDGYDQGSGAEADSPKARQSRAMQHFVDHFEEIPVVVLPCIKPRHGSLIDGASIYPACQNLLLAARALGYGGVLTGWHGAVEAPLRALVGLPDDYVFAATIPLGRPQGKHGPVRRMPIAELVFDDVWQGEAPWAAEPEGTRHTSW